MQVTYNGAGPTYLVNDYFPHYHYQTGYVLANLNYDLLIDYWGTDANLELAELDVDSRALDTLVMDGAVEDVFELLD
jgi:hypothetical protein